MYSNSSGLLTKHEVKLAGYTCMEKKEEGQYPAILTKQAWSIKDLRVNAYKNRPKSPINGTSRKIDFACILPIDRS